MPQARSFSVFQRPPPNVNFGELSDEAWLRLLKDCSKGKGPSSSGGGSVMASDVIGPLNNHARAEPSRFANLTAQMGENVSPAFFGTILEALVPFDDAGKQREPAPTLDDTALWRVIARLHALPNHPCGRAICSVAYRIAAKQLPLEIVGIVGYCAVHDPDPTLENGERSGKKLINLAINTVRGNATDALGKILFAQPDLAPFVLPFIEKLAEDRSPSIRAVTNLDHNIVYEHRTEFVVGQLGDIRKRCNDLATKTPPAWHFVKDRQHWTMRSATDQGFPLHGAWQIKFGDKKPRLESATRCWRAEKATAMDLELAYTGQATTARISWKRLDDDKYDDKKSLPPRTKPRRQVSHLSPRPRLIA